MLMVVFTAMVATSTQTLPDLQTAKMITKAFISSTATERVYLPGSLNEQKCRNFMRDAMACSILANGLISKNNNMSRIGIGAAGSFVGSLALAAAYAQQIPKKNDATAREVEGDSAAKKLSELKALKAASDSSSDNPATPISTEHEENSKILFMIAWCAYLAGQNLPQIIDFVKDAVYRKNFWRATWDTLCANRDRAEWAAIFVRNLGPLAMHYTPAGKQFSDMLPEIPGWAFQDEDAMAA